MEHLRRSSQRRGTCAAERTGFANPCIGMLENFHLSGRDSNLSSARLVHVAHPLSHGDISLVTHRYVHEVTHAQASAIQACLTITCRLVGVPLRSRICSAELGSSAFRNTRLSDHPRASRPVVSRPRKTRTSTRDALADRDGRPPDHTSEYHPCPTLQCNKLR
jgi:hypothetical protein